MLKALVFSDSHFDVDTMIEVVQTEKPDLLFHLGDSAKDALSLMAYYPGIPLHYVIGNTDASEDGETNVICAVDRHRILLAHGHFDGINQQLSGIESLFARAMEEEADVVLFGHSHQPFTYCRNRIWLFNPGRIGRKSSKTIHATYGMLLISDGKIGLIHQEL